MLKGVIQKYNIESCDYLKIDTEGHDCVIIDNYIEAILKNYTKPAKRIKFETNILSNESDIELIIMKLSLVGYTLVSKGHDTVMEHIS